MSSEAQVADENLTGHRSEDNEDLSNSRDYHFMIALKSSDFEIQWLGESKIPSPMKAARFVGDDERVLFHGTLADI
jgi:hypothetical protein